jgi:citrate lyase beta subunit
VGSDLIEPDNEALMATDLAHASVLLFVPGNRPDRFDKARAAGADAVVIDLEDAVGAGEKDSARRATANYLSTAPRNVPLLVRINSLGTRWALGDLAALADGGLPADGLVLAKVESARDVEIVRAHSPSGMRLVATIETAAGLSAAAAIAASLATGDAIGFGGADMAADLGCAFSWEPLLFARGRLVEAAASRRLPLIDVPFLDTSDEAGLRDETAKARCLGFTAKFAIHPLQVSTIRAAFEPTESEISRAGAIVAALASAAGGVVELDGKMIDVPVALAARRTLARIRPPSRMDSAGARVDAFNSFE